MSYSENPYQSFGVPADMADADARVDFIRKTYIHLTGAVLAFAFICAVALQFEVVNNICAMFLQSRFMYLIAMFGLMGPVTVKGANFNSVMQPPPMTDSEIANVLTYIRNSWGNQGTMLTKEMVGKVREATAGHVGPWKPEDLEPFKDKNIPGEITAGPGATAAPASAPAAAPAAK